MKLTISLAALLIASPAFALDVDANQNDGCSGCTNEPGGWGEEPDPAPEPDPTPEPDPEPADAPGDPADAGDFMRANEKGSFITGPIDWTCRNRPICQGGER